MIAYDPMENVSDDLVISREGAPVKTDDLSENLLLESSAPPQTPRNRRGDVLAGRYELLEQVARGGSGTVFKARDRRLGRHVAVKIAYPRDAKQRARLIREARIGAQLFHPSLMQVLDHGIESSCIYIVMPYIMGPTLRARVNAASLPWQTAGVFVHQLLVALAVLHNAGVVHRDVKSDNCLLSHNLTGERLILADFGLARIDRASLADLPAHQTSQVIASIGYMAPERIDSQGDIRVRHLLGRSGAVRSAHPPSAVSRNLRGGVVETRPRRATSSKHQGRCPRGVRRRWPNTREIGFNPWASLMRRY